MPKFRHLIALVLVLLTACASTPDRGDALREAQYAWSAAIRWGDIDGAWTLVDPEYRAGHPLTSLELERYKQVQVSRYHDLGSQVSGDRAFEVVLGVTLTCTVGEKTAYLCEVQQAGVFGLAGFDEQTLDAMLGTHCPHALYPYARQAIAELIQGGGFPPFLLQPINFESLYTEGLRQRAQQQAQGNGGLADAEAAGNA